MKFIINDKTKKIFTVEEDNGQTKGYFVLGSDKRYSLIRALSGEEYLVKTDVIDYNFSTIDSSDIKYIAR